MLARRRPEAPAETAAFVGSDGPRAIAIPTDVTEPESVRALFEATRRASARLHLPFNNAGVWAPPVPLIGLTLDTWRRGLVVNLTGAFLGTPEAFRLITTQAPRGGRIINDGSLSMHAPRPDPAPDTWEKHAITGLIRWSALNGRKWDNACGQIDDRNADTARTARMRGGVPQSGGSVSAGPTIGAVHVARAVESMATLPRTPTSCP